MSQRRSVPIREPAQMRALASMVRQEVLDTVHALGSCSIHEIARALGRPSDGLYYHVRVLSEVGLLEDAGTRPASQGEEFLVRTPATGVLRLQYDPDDEDNVQAITKIVGSMLRVTEKDFHAGFKPDLARCDGPRRNLHACRQKARLNDTELREVNQLLARLQQIFTRRRASAEGKLHSLTFVLAPLESVGPRRDSVEEFVD